MKRLCIALLLVAVLMSGCAAGETGSSSNSSVSSTSSVTGEVELTQYTSESLGISFELDSKWVVEDSPLEPTLNLSIGAPLTEITLTIVEGSINPENYSKDIITTWLEAKYSENYYMSGKFWKVDLNDVSSLQSGVNAQKLTYLSVSDVSTWMDQDSESDSTLEQMTHQELWYWIGLPENKVLIIQFGIFVQDESKQGFDELSSKVADLVESVQYVNKPIGYNSPDRLLPVWPDNYDLII